MPHRTQLNQRLRRPRDEQGRLQCNWCQEWKGTDQFRARFTPKGTRTWQSYCRPCEQDLNRQVKVRAKIRAMSRLLDAQIVQRPEAA